MLTRLRAGLCVGAPFILVLSLAADEPLTQADSDRLSSKLTQIQENGEAADPAALSTRITEAELNSYLRFAAAEQLPTGVTEPYFTLEGEGRVSGRAVVDLDQVTSERKSEGEFDPPAFLGGTVPVTVAGLLRTRDGIVRFELASATVSGIRLPTELVQTLVERYFRSPENPDGVSLDDPFQLPDAIREIEVGKGEAVVIQ